jgi:hypothetical protein
MIRGFSFVFDYGRSGFNDYAQSSNRSAMCHQNARRNKSQSSLQLCHICVGIELNWRGYSSSL